MNSATKRKPLRNIVMDLMDELNMNSISTPRSGSNQRVSSPKREDKTNQNLLFFKRDYLVGRVQSIDRKRPESQFFKRAVDSGKGIDLTDNILNQVNKRKENIYLKTEMTINQNNQREEKKRQIVALLTSGNFSHKQSKTDERADKNKIIRSLQAMKLKLDSNNHMFRR